MTNTKCLLVLTLLLLISASVCQALTSDHHNGADQQDQKQEHEEQLGGKLVDEELLEEEDLSDLDDLEEYDEEGAGGGGRFETLSSFPTSGGANLVVNVNEGSTGRLIQQHEHVLLLGFAPWCVQSQALLPEFAAAAGLLADHGSGVVFAKLDAINNPNVASQYSIRGFPTVLFFTNGSRAEYSGGNSRWVVAEICPFMYHFHFFSFSFLRGVGIVLSGAMLGGIALGEMPIHFLRIFVRF
jgi:thiol-disulfide isomerase/thioredoxin